MKTLLLRLEGPMQSWGLSSRFDERDSSLEPTKSGVIGLCGAALGLSRDDDAKLAELARLDMAIRVDKQGSLGRDFQTAGGGRFAGEDYGVSRASGGRGETVTSRRVYLADASFLVGLGGNDEALLASLADALRSPRWPLALGRRAFVPTSPVYEGVVEDDVIAAVANWPKAPPEADVKRRLVVEVTSGGRPRRDVPLSFSMHDRRYAVRFVESRAWEQSSHAREV